MAKIIKETLVGSLLLAAFGSALAASALPIIMALAGNPLWLLGYIVVLPYSVFVVLIIANILTYGNWRGV